MGIQLNAQKDCSSYLYAQQQLQNNPSLQFNKAAVEDFIQRKIASRSGLAARGGHGAFVITIPVVVHVLYNKAGENLSDNQIIKQIEILNECFSRRNADTVKTPNCFRDIAADCAIKFQLAISDPGKYATNGIIHKYTPVKEWGATDDMKFSNKGGADAWDTDNYLNIWICNFTRAAGYASFPGGADNIDGIVLAYDVVGINNKTGYEGGKTLVHETGHWLGLRHIWGDADCGDDFIDDTPKQATYTNGCPSGVRKSCNNGPNGDMYMNYMDITADACTNLFTIGQMDRMRVLFDEGGPRVSFLASYGLMAPLFGETAQPGVVNKWDFAQVYPNPASSEMTIDLSYDPRWVGSSLTVTNSQGQFVMQVSISNKIQKIDISKLKQGLYFIAAKKQDGAKIQQKFIKL